MLMNNINSSNQDMLDVTGQLNSTDENSSNLNNYQRPNTTNAYRNNASAANYYS